MSSEEFTLLAARQLAGELTPQERSSLDQALAADPDLQKEWRLLQEGWQIAAAGMPLTQAMDQSAPSLPLHHLASLKTTVRRKIGPQPLAATPWWRQPSFFGLATAGGTFMAIFVLAYFFLAPAPPTLTALGYLQMDQTRGTSSLSPWPELPKTRSYPFAEETAFEKWKTAPLSTDERAKAWIEEETDTLYLKLRSSDGREMEKTVKLPQDIQARKKLLQDTLK